MTPEQHARLMELFDRACELDTGAREALLDELRREDGALAERLANMLAADAARSPVLETGAAAAAALVSSVGGAPPERIGRYRIVSTLGRGGMGVVYEAEQDTPRRRVALKVLPGGATSTLARARFRREIEVLARLQHEGIAQIYDSGADGERLYFAMELCVGLPLGRHVRAHPGSVRARLELLAAICDAVHHAHLKQVVHRDLKPANIIVLADGRPKVLDFGIARSLSAGAEPGITRAESLLGTPGYMSPEQLSSGAVDARTDVYSLGVIGYELLGGRLPHPAEGRTLAEIARDVVVREPPRLSTLDAELAGDVETIIAHAMEREPERRYQSAGALADDLRRALADQPIAARPHTLWYQVAKFARRQRAVAAALLGLLVSLLAGVIVASVLLVRVERARRRAVAERARTAAVAQVLTQRTANLLISEARIALERDPTRALALLRELPPGLDAGTAAAADEVSQDAHDLGAADDLLDGHADVVHAVSFSPDGRAVISAGYDGALWWWDLTTRTRWRLASSGAALTAAQFGPDGTLLTAARDGGLALMRPGGATLRLAGHRAGIEQALWSPDGSFIASGDSAGGVRLWRSDGSLVRELAGPSTEIEALVWSPDGSRLAAGGKQGDVWLWDVAGGAARLIARSSGDQAALLFSDGGRALIAAGSDNLLRRYWLDDSAPVQQLDQHSGEIKALVLSPDGRWLASGGRGDHVFLRDLASGHSRALPGPGGVVRALAFSADAAFVAAGGDDRNVRLWRIDGGLDRVLRGHGAAVRALAFSVDGRLASGSNDGTVRLWSPGVRPRGLLWAHDGRITDVTFAGAALVSAGEDGTLRRWDPGTGTDDLRVGHRGQVNAVRAFANGTLVSGGRDFTVRVWRPDQPARELSAPEMPAELALAADGRIAAASALPDVLVWDGAAALTRMPGHQGSVLHVRFLPDGRLVSAGSDRTVRVWDGAGASRVAATMAGKPNDLVYAPGGSWLAVADAVGDIQVLPLAGGAARRLQGHQGAVLALAFADGATLVSGGSDRSVRVWPLGGGAPELLLGHSGRVTAVAVLADGRIASASEDGTVRLWQRGGGVRVLHGRAPVRRLAVSADGRRLGAAEDDGLVRLYDLDAPPPPLPDERRAARLTPAGTLESPWREVSPPVSTP